jgi:hypothetical protein
MIALEKPACMVIALPLWMAMAMDDRMECAKGRLEGRVR